VPRQVEKNPTITGSTNHAKYQFFLRLLEQNLTLDAIPNATETFLGSANFRIGRNTL